MTYAQQTWVDNVTPVDKAHMDHIEQGIGLASPPYGTSLPASPVDGQEAILSDSLSNSTFIWGFRYNAGHTADAHKWEFLNGAPYVVASLAQTLAGGTVCPATPRFSIPRAGGYYVWASVDYWVPNGTDTGVALGVGSAAAAPTDWVYGQIWASPSFQSVGVVGPYYLDLPAGGVIGAWFSNPVINVGPIRLTVIPWAVT